MYSPFLKILRQRRFHVTFMLFLGFFNLYALRVNLSVAIVAMTEGTQSGYEAEFDWNSKEQGVILSSFFYGYLLTLFGGGVIASKIGGQHMYGIGVFCSSILTLLTPLAAKWGLAYVILVRVLEGIFSGVCYPSLHAIWVQWAPPMERSQLNAIAFAGMYAGTVAMMPIAGILSENYGWRSVFYFTGSIGCAWYFLWILWIRKSPETDKYITDEEKHYIIESLSNEPKPKKLPTPWKSIFTSGPVWAICAANIAEDWGFYTLLTQLPTYLSQTLNLNLESTGLISALPYIALTTLTFPVSFFADWSRKRGWLTTTQVRKILSCTGMIAEASLLIAAAAVAHPVYSIVCIIFAVGMNSFATSAYCVNALDIAPQYASIIMGLSNSFGTMTGIISPTLSGFLVQNATTAEWNRVFATAACIYCVATVIYFFLGSGEVQPWAKMIDTQKPEDTEAADTAKVKELKLNGIGKS